MKTLGNIIWIVFGGLHIALEYFIAGLILMITIIGIPFGLQSLKRSSLAASGYGSHTSSTVSYSASPSLASHSERCTSDWQSWLFHLLGKKLVKSQKAIEIS